MSDSKISEDREMELIYSQSRISEANSRLKKIKEIVGDTSINEIGSGSLDDFELWVDIQHVIEQSQFVIEMSAKAMFTTVGVEYPKSHGIEFTDNRTGGLLNHIPEEFNEHNRIPRVLFLTNVWRQYYTISKYGVPEWNIRPASIFTMEDALRGFKDAKFSNQVSKDLFNAQLDELDFEFPDF